MFRRFAMTASLLAALCCAVGNVSAEDVELVENPQYASWAKHKPGTAVVMQMTTNAQGQAMNMEITQTLAELTPDKAVIEVKTAMDMMGQKQEMPSQKVPVNAKVGKAEAAKANLPQGVDGETKEVGTETITVAGKGYECKVTEFAGEQQGIKTKGKVWRCDQVPGGVAKVDMTFEGAQAGNMSMQLVSIDAK
jgi:hypothetical protein